jgi:hypothetical protein
MARSVFAIIEAPSVLGFSRGRRKTREIRQNGHGRPCLRGPRDHAAEGAAARMNRKLRTPTDPLSRMIKPTSLNIGMTSQMSK